MTDTEETLDDMVKTKTVKDSQAVITQLMQPTSANYRGTVHGGEILKLVDTVAYVCAARHSNQYCVTASFDRVDFHHPIYIGELVTLKGSVNYVGKTSMEVGVRVEAEDIRTGKIRHTNTCYVTMVAVDEKGKPVPVPKLLPETPDEKRRHAEGETRRNDRLKRLTP